MIITISTQKTRRSRAVKPLDNHASPSGLNPPAIGTSALGSVLENVRLVERTAVVQVTDRVAGYEPFEATLSGIAEFAF